MLEEEVHRRVDPVGSVDRSLQAPGESFDVAHSDSPVWFTAGGVADC